MKASPIGCPRCGGSTRAADGRCAECGAETLVPTGLHAAATARTPSQPVDPHGPTARTVPDPDATTERPIPSLEPAQAKTPDATGTRMRPLEEAATAERAPGAVARGAGPLAPGQDFGNRYHIIRTLGVGGMGAVYQAWDRELEVAVALKVIRLDTAADPVAARDMERRFKRELLLARQVTHRNVVRIHDLGELEGIKYITMPYIQGIDVAALLRREGRLPAPRVLRIARQAAAGLAAAHAAGVVHRDLKPANIMLDADDTAYLMDFGIARTAEPTAGQGLTQAGSVVGTLEYMAPEQAMGKPVDRRADIYAFGLILYDMLVRRRSTGADSAMAELVRRLKEPLPSPRSIDPAVPEALDRIIAKCIELDAEARYQTTEELAAALDSLDAEGNQAAPAPTPAPSSATGVLAPGVGVTGPAFPPVTGVSPAAPAAAGGTRPRLQRRLAVAAAIAAAVLVGVGAWVAKGRLGPAARPAAAAEPTTLAILPFRNASGDPMLDWVGRSLAEILGTEMGQSAYLHTVPSDRLQQVLLDLRIPADQSFDPPTLRRVAEFCNAKTVVWGQYVKFGSQIRIDATLQDLERQRTVPLKAEAQSQEGLLAAVEQLAQAVREGLASSADVLAELRAQTLKPSSRSFEALRYYTDGVQLARQGEQQDAVKRFAAATQEDPEFALAFARLGQAYASLGHDTEADQASRKAVDLSERLPLQERFLILAVRARIQNDPQKAVESYQNLLKAAPEDTSIRFDLAQLYESTGAFDQAAEQLGKVLERDPKYVNALLAMGRVEIKRKKPQASLDPLNRALALAVQFDNDAAKADVLNAIGIAYKRLEKQEDALRYYRDSLEIKRKRGEKGGIAASLSEIAQVQARLGNRPDALKSYDEALQLRREIGDKRGIGNTLLDLGTFQQDAGRLDEALGLFKESLQIQRELGNRNYQALCLNNIGTIYLGKGQYEDAQTYLERALELRQKEKVPLELAETLHNLAETSSKLGQYEQALARYLEALELARAAGSQWTAAIESYSVGTVFEHQGRYGAALKAKQDALQALRELKDRSFWMAEVLSGYGASLTLIGRGDEAAEPLKEALALARELKNQALVGQAVGLQGDRLFYAGDVGGAKALYEQALQLATKTTDRHLTLQAKVDLARVAVQEGRHQQAKATLAQLGQEADTIGLKALSVECSVLRGRALLGLRDHAGAQEELERATARAEKLGLKALVVKGQFYLAEALRARGRDADARRRYADAFAGLADIAKEAQSEGITRRADLAPIQEQATRLVKRD